MVESLGWLLAGPWIHAVVAVSVILDVFLPVLPSGILVVAAATAAAQSGAFARGDAHQDLPTVLALLLSAATASVLGDLLAHQVAARGGGRLLARSVRLRRAQERLGAALARGGGTLVILARFAPAGRSVVAFGSGAAGRGLRHFLPWSASAGIAWAAYSVSLGYFGAQWLGAGAPSAAISLLALFGSGIIATHLLRRPAAAVTAQPVGVPGTRRGSAPPDVRLTGSMAQPDSGKAELPAA